MTKTHTLIIGGTKGMGRALVKILAHEKHILSVVGRKLLNNHRSKTRNTIYWIFDVVGKDLNRNLDEIINTNGRINNIVFFQRYRGKEDEWIGEIEVSLTATKNIIEYRCLLISPSDVEEERNVSEEELKLAEKIEQIGIHKPFKQSKDKKGMM